MHYPLVIIGAGLSGLAAGIRYARFGGRVLIVEQHTVCGGLNSWYRRCGHLLETGLHAMTNFAPPEDKHAPLNLLFRQLKLSRRSFGTHEQFVSSSCLGTAHSLCFSNDFKLLEQEIGRLFPHALSGFRDLTAWVDGQDPFTPRPFQSARDLAASFLKDEQLVTLLLFPLLFYGSCVENDLDTSQFVILFRAIYQQGFFRPAGTMKQFLDMLLGHYRSLGGTLRLSSRVEGFAQKDGRVRGVRLASGETISCDAVLSTAGLPATLRWLAADAPADTAPYEGRLSFFETISIVPRHVGERLAAGQTIVFYHPAGQLAYRAPEDAVDTESGVICFASNFQGMPPGVHAQIRVTHLANYDVWRSATPEAYTAFKREWVRRSRAAVEARIGSFTGQVIFSDAFTPLTVERFTGKARGAVYGSPVKFKDGKTPCDNLFIAGTDQGYLGIVGAMLSGVTMVNNHLLGKDDSCQ